MTARRLTNEETLWAQRNMTVCFGGSFDENQSRTALQDPSRPAPDPTYGAFVDGMQTPAATLIVNPYRVRFDGHAANMGGIGGVATLPPFRHMGLVRAIMSESHREMHAGGTPFAALHPFARGFYKQFGYAPGAPLHVWTLPHADLSRIPDQGGSVTQLFPGDSLEPLLCVYEKAMENVNLSSIRESFDPELEKSAFLNEGRSIFVWWENEQPCGFLIGHMVDRVMHCESGFSHKGMCLYTSPRALLALLHFFHTAFLSHASALCLTLPAEMDLYSFLPGGFSTGSLSTECAHVHNGMIRVVHAENALQLARCQGNGSLCVEVDDALIPENSGRFLITFRQGADNQVSRTDREPDLTITPGALAQLLCGIKTPLDFPFMEGVCVHRPDAPFSALFYPKACRFWDLF
ncbi:MAG: GNAT family N-acetyltransferase [Clostridia bacterium]|nr:GNAT family N-acetyltransferase [Clostridia bacterium]